MANPKWVRWIFASVADHLKQVATSNSIAVLIEGLDDRSETFLEAADRVEIRLTGPFAQEQSKDYWRLLVDANVLITSRLDGASNNRYASLDIAGLFQEAMDRTIDVYRYGDGDAFLGCLMPRSGRKDSVRVLHFGVAQKDRLKQSEVDARYEMYLDSES